MSKRPSYFRKAQRQRERFRFVAVTHKISPVCRLARYLFPTYQRSLFFQLRNSPRNWLRARFGRGRSVEQLATWLGYSPEDLRSLKPSYREVTVPKQRGGHRVLHIPDDETRALQRRIHRRVLSGLRSHDAAFAFEKGRSIVENAKCHQGAALVHCVDIKDYFSTTQAWRLEAYFRRVGWNRDSARLLTSLCTYNGALPTGAPTSPRLSNLINFYLDEQLTLLAKRFGGRYSRYADDLTFSFPVSSTPVGMVTDRTTRILKVLGYSLNHRKTRTKRQHQQQRVTGLVVNRTVNVPRKNRRTLRAALHRIKYGKKATHSAEYLEGYKRFIEMVKVRR